MIDLQFLHEVSDFTLEPELSTKVVHPGYSSRQMNKMSRVRSTVEEFLRNGPEGPDPFNEDETQGH